METTQNARPAVLAALDRGVETGELAAALRLFVAASSPVFGCQKRQCLLSVFRIVTFVCGILAVSSLLPGANGLEFWMPRDMIFNQVGVLQICSPERPEFVNGFFSEIGGTNCMSRHVGKT